MHTFEPALALLVSLFVVNLSQAGVPHITQKYYDEIDSYLTSAVATDDVEKNMEKAAEYLAELEKKGSIPLIGNSLARALKQMLQLKDVVGEDKCNRDAYEILAKNDENTGHPLNYQHRKASTRRVDLIVKYYAEKHFENCKKVWPEILASKLEEVTPETMAYVMKFAGASSFPWHYVYHQMKWINLLRSYNKADPDRVKAADKKKYSYQKNMVTQADYKKYVVNPCKEVRKRVSDELCEPIRFDIDTQGRNSEYQGAENEEFRQNRIIMDWCQYVHTFEMQIWDGIYEVMENEKEGDKRVERKDKRRLIEYLLIR